VEKRSLVPSLPHKVLQKWLRNLESLSGGAPKVLEELHGQRKLDEGMEASFEGTCKLWKVKKVIGFPNLC